MLFRSYDRVQHAWTQYTLYTVGLHLLKLYAPFIPYVTETLYQTLYRAHESTASLHTTLLDIPAEQPAENANVLSTMKHLLHVVSEVRKQKSEAQCSLKTEVKKLTISVASTELQTALQREETTICGITKARRCDVVVDESLEGLAQVHAELIIEPSDAS